MGEIKDVDDEIDFQTAYIANIVKESSYPYDLDVAGIFHPWAQNRRDDITTYRDQTHTSKFTGTKSPAHHTPFMKAFDDSMECFLNQP